MAGENLFRLASTKSLAAHTLTQARVFISHRQSDKEPALAVASYLADLGIDFYIDERDELLAAAMVAQNANLVVTYIEAGITISTHLLGIISENTKGSWWVPFEIGSARQRELHIAYLLLDSVDCLPEYLKIATHLQDRIDLRNWVRDELGQRVYLATKSIRSPLADIPRLPDVRASQLTFVRTP